MTPLLPGFSFRETLRGTYWRLDAPLEELALTLSLEARAGDVARFVRDRVWTVTGVIDAQGLATRRPVEGSILFHLPDERRLPYRVRFEGDDGGRYELSGQKEWLGVAPVASMTTLPVTIYDPRGQELGRGTLRFDARRDWARWLRSFRLRLPR